MGLKRNFLGLLSRSTMKAKNNLGVIKIPMPDGADKIFRDTKLEIFDAYYEGRQYDHLNPWSDDSCTDGSYIPVRQRKPRIIYSFAKVLCQRMTSKLIGSNVFPKFQIEDDPMTEEYIRYVIKAANLKSVLLEPIRRTLNTGAALVRFYFVDGKIKTEAYQSKYCYPEFNAGGDLESVRIQYVYPDKNDKDESGKPKMKWWRMDLGQVSDIKYDNPDYEVNKEPQFKVVAQADHELGFVQAEWFRTSENKDTPDGYSLIADILDFIDEINYSISQSSTTISYNQDPILAFNNMDEDELGVMIRSSAKAWNLGREGSGQFIESSLNGVNAAQEMRDKIRVGIQDIARLVLLDPEKIVGHAQSAKAMEVLHGPMIELIEELRPIIGKSLENLVTKLAITNLILTQRGEPGAVTMPKGYQPQSLSMNVTWPPVFQMTIQDLQQKVQMVTTATSANIISRATGTQFLAKDFDIEDVEEETRRIDAQPVINPFGGF